MVTLPVEDIAAMMGKTPAQVATMMDEAVAKGYIRGFEAMIDWEQAGINVVEAVIELHVSPRHRNSSQYGTLSFVGFFVQVQLAAALIRA